MTDFVVVDSPTADVVERMNAVDSRNGMRWPLKGIVSTKDTADAVADHLVT